MDVMIEQVRLRAYELWQMNGMSGCDIAHWTAAETELRARAVKPATAKRKKVSKAAPKLAARKAATKKDIGLSVPSAL